MRMLLPPALFIFFLVLSVGRCQFVYNYEEADADGTDGDSIDQSYQYNSPAATNDQFQSQRVQNTNVQDERHNTGSRRSSVREQSPMPETETQPPFEYIEESETPRNDPAQKPRKRKYRRIFREGTYVAPPQPPRVNSPSVFENIRLGQAPNGVYVPQDSFLNVLNNPSYRQNTASQYNPQPISPYYQPSAIQGPTFYVEPTSNEERRASPNAQPGIQPNVRYADVSASSMSADSNTGDNVETSNSRRTQDGRQRRQRRPNQSSSLPETAVDIDALKTRPDVIRDVTPYVPQARQVTQPRTRQRQTVAVPNYQNSNQVSRAYSPSVFQNVRLGEAPNGVHIPEDSLLNVLRSPTRSQLPAVNTYENSQPSSLLPNHVDEEPNYVQPETPAQPESNFSDSRRQSRQRSRSNNNSERSMQRRTQYQGNDGDSLRTYTAPASSQQQSRQQTSARNSNGNRRRVADTPKKRHNTPRQEVDELSESSQSSSAGQQTNYKPAKLAVAALPEDTDEDGIPGEAGVNYPTLHTIPRTSFSCSEQEHNGYYADLETSCQVFHLCQARGGKSSFLCSNGTIFSQEKFSCQWWYKVNCEESPKFYSINDNLYKTPEKKSSRQE